MVRLQASHLNLYRSGKPVLNDINFTVNAGETYALLGGNGAGKSTTLLSFLGFLKPHSGQVLVNQQDVQANLPRARQVMTYLPESASLYEHFNAYENLNYFLALTQTSVTQDQLDTVLDQVALKQTARSQRLRHYSKGMRQKVAIALAILRDTDILLLDEPTSGLDPQAIDEFNQWVRHLGEQSKTILMVTHDIYGACQVADKIGLLHQGRLVQEFVPKNQQPIDTAIIHQAFIDAASVT